MDTVLLAHPQAKARRDQATPACLTTLFGELMPDSRVSGSDVNRPRIGLHTAGFGGHTPFATAVTSLLSRR